MSNFKNAFKIIKMLTNDKPSIQEQGLSLLDALGDEELWQIIRDDLVIDEDYDDWTYFTSDTFSLTPGLFAAYCMNPLTHDSVTDLVLDVYRFELNDQPFPKNMLAYLGQLTKLRKLKLITGALRSDCLEKSAFDDLTFLSNLNALTYLELQDCGFKTTQGLEGLTALKYVKITEHDCSPSYGRRWNIDASSLPPHVNLITTWVPSKLPPRLKSVEDLPVGDSYGDGRIHSIPSLGLTQVDEYIVSKNHVGLLAAALYNLRVSNEKAPKLSTKDTETSAMARVWTDDWTYFGLPQNPLRGLLPPTNKEDKRQFESSAKAFTSLETAVCTDTIQLVDLAYIKQLKHLVVLDNEDKLSDHLKAIFDHELTFEHLTLMHSVRMYYGYKSPEYIGASLELPTQVKTVTLTLGLEKTMPVMHHAGQWSLPSLLTEGSRFNWHQRGKLEFKDLSKDLTRVSKWSNVETLNLKYFSALTDGSLLPLGIMSKLTALSVTQCPKIKRLSSLAGIKKLRSLHIDNEASISLTGLNQLSQLRTLDFGTTPTIWKPKDLKALATFNNLEQLNLGSMCEASKSLFSKHLGASEHVEGALQGDRLQNLIAKLGAKKAKTRTVRSIAAPTQTVSADDIRKRLRGTRQDCVAAVEMLKSANDKTLWKTFTKWLQIRKRNWGEGVEIVATKQSEVAQHVTEAYQEPVAAMLLTNGTKRHVSGICITNDWLEDDGTSPFLPMLPHLETLSFPPHSKNVIERSSEILTLVAPKLKTLKGDIYLESFGSLYPNLTSLDIKVHGKANDLCELAGSQLTTMHLAFVKTAKISLKNLKATKLKSLALKNVDIKDFETPKLDHLRRLEIEGEIPTLGGLRAPNLEDVRIGNDKWRRITTSLKRIEIPSRALKKLKIHNCNKLTALRIESQNLETLTVTHCPQLKDTSAAFDVLTDLEIHNSLGDLFETTSLKALKRLSLVHWQGDLSTLNICEQLEHLELYGNFNLNSLPQLPKLERLIVNDASSLNIKYALTRDQGKTSDLQSAELKSLEGLCNLPQLKNLELRGRFKKLKDYSALAHLKNLEQLTVTDYAAGKSSLAALQETLPTLRISRLKPNRV